MKQLTLFCTITLAMLLTGCATTVVDPTTGSTTILTLKDVAIADLTKAAASATAHNDPVAAQCWNGLIPVAQQIQDYFKSVKAPVIDIAKSEGVFTTYQNLRNAKAEITSKANVLLVLAQAGKLKQIHQAINMACAALKLDVAGGIADPLSIVTGQQPK